MKLTNYLRFLYNLIKDVKLGMIANLSWSIVLPIVGRQSLD